MKKTIFWLAIIVVSTASFALIITARADSSTPETTSPTTLSASATTVTAPALTVVATSTATKVAASTIRFRGQELEKIDSPEQLRGFKVMRRIGHTLYGIRRQFKREINREHSALREGQKDNALSPSQSDNYSQKLEKIESPEQLKEFKVMKRIGHTLYGIRLSILKQLRQQMGNKQGPQSKLNAQRPTVSQASNKLEKIGAPQLIHLYERIRRIGHSLWGVKRGDIERPSRPEHPTEGGISKSFTPVTSQMVSCVSSAISAKDQAVVSRLVSAENSLKSAINDRTACQLSAIQSTTGQQIALESCAQAFQTTREQIHRVSQQAQKEAWTTYRQGLQTCRANSLPTMSTSTLPTVSTPVSANSESQGELMIPDGGNTAVTTLLNNGSGD